MQRRSPEALLLIFAVALGVLWLRVRASGWELVGDEAIIVMRSRDVFGEGSSLLGMPSSFNAWESSADPFHPGPTPFWVLAPFTVLIGSSVDGALLATWVLVMGSVASVLWVSTRLLGPERVWWAAACLLGVLLIDNQIWRPLTPVMVIAPALATAFLAWMVVAGKGHAWPLLVMFASLTVHADLSYLPTSVSLVVLGLAVTVVRWRRSVGSGTAAPMSRRSVAATLGVGFALWVLPLVDALANSGGNVGELVRAAGADVTTRGIVHALGSANSTAILLGAVLVVAALTWGNAGAVMRALGMTAVVSSVAATLGQAATPASVGIQPLYRLPLDVSTAFLCFAAVILLLDVARSAPWPSRCVRSVPVVRSVALVPLAIVIVLQIATMTLSGGWLSESFPAAGPLASQVDHELSDGAYELRALGGPKRIGLGHAVALHLQERGIHVRVERGQSRYLGAHRERSGDEAGTIYITAGSDQAPTATARAVARWESPARSAFDPTSTRRQVAGAIRDQPVPTITGTSLWVGGVVAGSGEDTRLVVGLDEDGLNATGEWFIEDPSRLHQLSDLAITDLIAEGLIEASESVAASATLLGSAPLFVVWLDSTEPGDAVLSPSSRGHRAHTPSD